MLRSVPRVAVVGGGVAGLATAALLAQSGAAVSLFERLPYFGGLAAARTLDGMRFSPGPQYVWGFGEGGTGRRVFERIGARLPMRPMPENFDRLAIADGPCAAVRRGVCWPLLEPWVAGDPRSEAAVRRLVTDLDLLGRASEAISRRARYMDGGAAMAAAVLRDPALPARSAHLVVRHRGDSVARFARRYGVPPEALRAIMFHQGICADRLDVSSVVFFAALRHVASGRLWVPAGGMCALVDALVDRARALGVDLRAGAAVEGVRRADGELQLLTSDDPPAPFDRVVLACPPPVAAALCDGVEVAYSPGGAVVALCLSVELDAAVRHHLSHTNFTWYRSHTDPVCFMDGAHTLDYLNYTSPTLNGGLDDERAVVCAFYPGRRGRADLTAEAERRIVADLRRFGAVRVRAREVVDRARWNAEHGAHGGAIYGRHSSARSVRRKVVVRTPPGVRLVHSAIGVPGILGGLEMAERVADELLGEWRSDAARRRYAR